MKFVKNNSNIIILVSAILFVGILITLANFSNNNMTTGLKKSKITQKTYEEKFPFLRELVAPKDLSGTVTVLEDGWILYENKVFGFKVEYPGRKFNYGILKPHENKDLWHNNYLNQNEESLFYEVSFSANDSPPIYVNISSSRFHTINEWIMNNPDYKKPNYIFVRRNISGLNAVTVLYAPEFPPFTDEQLERRTYVIKDDILYMIGTRDISSTEYERVWSSFQFLNKALL